MRRCFANFAKHIGPFDICIQQKSLLLSAPDVKGGSEHLKGIPLPPNPAQVPNPIQPHRTKDQVPAEPVHHRQSEFLHNTLKKGILILTGELLLEVLLAC